MSISNATNLVGGLIQGIAASQAQRSMGHTYQDEIARQNAYRAQGFNTLSGYLPSLGAEEANRELVTGASQREQMYHDVGNISLAPGRTPFNAVDSARMGLLGQRRAATGAYSDWELNQMINKIKTQEQLNKISNFAAGTAQVFPYRMWQAQHSQDELDFWGKMISSIGGGAPWSGSGGPPSSAGAGPVNPANYNYNDVMPNDVNNPENYYVTGLI